MSIENKTQSLDSSQTNSLEQSSPIHNRIASENNIYSQSNTTRLIGKRGYDVITNSYFVEEEIIQKLPKTEKKKTNTKSFTDFRTYYDYLDGNIYENACYTFCTFPPSEIEEKSLDLQSLYERTAFVEETLDDYCYSSIPSKDELADYRIAEKTHRQCLNWMEKFNSAKTCDELAVVSKKYLKSKLATLVGIEFFLCNYLSANNDASLAFATVMEYISKTNDIDHKLINGLCSIYGAENVLKHFKKVSHNRRSQLRLYIDALNDENIVFSHHYHFSKTTHFYCETIVGRKINSPYAISRFCRYFKSFDEFIFYRKGDLTNCDLSALLSDDIDFSNYVINSSTTLPPHTTSQPKYVLKTGFSKEYFHVLQQWRGPFNCLLREHHHKFKYFFDYVYFLKGDLSGADLVSCDGLSNLKSWDSINLTNAKLTTAQRAKFGLTCKQLSSKPYLLPKFPHIEKNEFDTFPALSSHQRNITSNEACDCTYIAYINSVHYISDIHLSHLKLTAKCQSFEDDVQLFGKVAEKIASFPARIIVIAGDTASDFEDFELFVKLLSKRISIYTTVIFTLGNHELWGFRSSSIDEIVLKYRTLLNNHGMYLLHNDVLYVEFPNLHDVDSGKWNIIPYATLCKTSDTQLIEQLQKARYVFFGGLGFTGYNLEFNANHDVYQNVIDYNTDLTETAKFETLYNRLLPILRQKNSVVITHTPKECWSQNNSFSPDIVYVSGHTHRNHFYDDGKTRIYADNQRGYNNHSVELKYFLIDYTYDVFSDYHDGIHSISREQYVNFYRGLNIPITFHRNVATLYMLKKQGYYCFIAKNSRGKLSILNGGAFSRLVFNDIQYYYDNMDKIIARITSPFKNYTNYQNQIAHMIKQIGGEGTIHGCIIDIDFHNHIYVNPFDGTLTAYWASDVVHKLVFPSTPALLKANHPKLYDNLVQLLNSTTEDVTLLAASSTEHEQPEWYLDTDIYRASRQIRKMQRLDYRILSTWFDETSQSKALPKPL